jgi:hypothetical protein
VHLATRVAKATAARQAGRRGARCKAIEPKAQSWRPRRCACTCGGSRLRDGARNFTVARVHACRRLGHSSGPERRCTARRPKEPRDGTQHYARGGGGDGGGSCKKKIPSLARIWHHQRQARWRGGERRRFPFGSKAGASKEERGSSFSPQWPRAIAQVSVKRCGACLLAWMKKMVARWRGRRVTQRAATTWSAPPSRTALARRRRRTITKSQPRLLLLPLSSHVSGGGFGEEKPQLARVRAPGLRWCL